MVILGAGALITEEVFYYDGALFIGGASAIGIDGTFILIGAPMAGASTTKLKNMYKRRTMQNLQAYAPELTFGIQHYGTGLALRF